MSFLSKITYPGDGIVSSFSVPFPYIIKEHVKVYVAGVPNTTFTWTTPSTIQLAATPGIGIEVLIKRETPQSPLVSWQDGATLRAADLNKQALQTIYICQETIDNSAAAAEVGETVTLAAAAAAQSVLDAEAAVTAAEIAKTAAQAAQAATEALPKDASWITTGVFAESRISRFFEITEPLDANNTLTTYTVTAGQAGKNLYIDSNTPKWKTINLPDPSTVSGKVFSFIMDPEYGTTNEFYGVRIVGTFAKGRLGKVLTEGNTLVIKSNGAVYQIIHCEDTSDIKVMSFGASKLVSATGTAVNCAESPNVKIKREGSRFTVSGTITIGAVTNAGTGTYVFMPLYYAVGNKNWNNVVEPQVNGTALIKDSTTLLTIGQVEAYQSYGGVTINANKTATYGIDIVGASFIPVLNNRNYIINFTADIGGDW